MSSPFRSISWKHDSLYIIDQTRLPEEIVYLQCSDYRTVADAIRRLAVRGAPAIGVAAAYACVLALQEALQQGSCWEETVSAFHRACRFIESARPTAVNLSWAVRQMEHTFDTAAPEMAEEVLLQKAIDIESDDVDTCRAIGENGAALFAVRSNLRILTHCNTGALATAGIGTAFGVLATLAKRHQIECVYADETRPLLQGARLTATELMANHIPCCLITDNMAAEVMRDKQIDAVIVGADRIAANGDTANKIGTYGLAVLADYHHIPFYVAAPFSTFDFSISSGKDIVIEERDADEVRQWGNVYTAPRDVPVYNPAFDVTPSELIRGIITERGVIEQPYLENIAAYERSLTNETIHY